MTRAVWAVITTREPDGQRSHEQAVCFARDPTPRDEAQVFLDALLCTLEEHGPASGKGWHAGWRR